MLDNAGTQKPSCSLSVQFGSVRSYDGFAALLSEWVFSFSRVVVVLFSACVCCALCHFRLSNICRLLAYCQANFFYFFLQLCVCVCACVWMIAKQAYTKLTSCIGFTRICPPVRLFLSIYVCNASQSVELSICLSVCLSVPRRIHHDSTRSFRAFHRIFTQAIRTKLTPLFIDLFVQSTFVCVCTVCVCVRACNSQ